MINHTTIAYGCAPADLPALPQAPAYPPYIPPRTPTPDEVQRALDDLLRTIDAARERAEAQEKAEESKTVFARPQVTVRECPACNKRIAVCVFPTGVIELVHVKE